MILFSLIHIAFLAFNAPSATGQTVIGPNGDMVVSNIDASPDGFNRPVIAVNGEHPSPLIRANKGDNFNLNVINQLDNPTMLRQTSIHWHGIFQRTTAWADGADGVTQCPITQNGESFAYSFNAGDEAGTYWYHSHFGTQYCDGLRGPMVIYDRDNDPHRDLYEVDDETTVITLADWYHTQASSIRGAALSDATLINGKGRWPGGPEAPISVINVQNGTRYRFRLVSLSCDPSYRFSIDGHNLTIIEADGQPTKPHTVQRLDIFAGQRYSFVLDANQPAAGNYWIRAVPNIGLRNLPDFSSGGINSAILRYADAPATDPNTNATENPKALEEVDLQSLNDSTVPGGDNPADENVLLQLGGGPGTGFTVNGAQWTNPSSQDGPVMVQVMNGVEASKVMPQASIRTLPRNAIVEVAIEGLDFAGPHPFHLHGHAFSVVRSAGSSRYNHNNPVRRDVVNTGIAGDNVTIRFRTDNPGPWFFHCHIEFHLVAGLAMVFLEAPDAIPDTNNPPVEWDELCPKFDSLPASATSIQTVMPAPTV